MRASPIRRLVRPEISRFPCKERACMPGSATTPGRPSACVDALGHVAFRYTDSVGTREQSSIAAQWLACTFPYRRFADTLTDACARLGADVDRYSFIAGDFHPLLLAGLPAHSGLFTAGNLLPPTTAAAGDRPYDRPASASPDLRSEAHIRPKVSQHLSRQPCDAYVNAV